MSAIHPNFICPVSKQMFHDPVIALDGFTYERQVIVDWFRTKKSSPVTNETIATTLTPNNAIKQMIAELCEKSPELVKEKFEPDYSYHEFNIGTVINIINNRTYSDLLKYKHFDQSVMYDVYLISFFAGCNNYEIIKHFLDNLVHDYHAKIISNSSEYKGTIMYIIAQTGNLTALKYLIYEKKIYNRATIADKVYLFHNCCKNANFDTILYVLTNVISKYSELLYINPIDGNDYSSLLVNNNNLSSQQKKDVRNVVYTTLSVIIHKLVAEAMVLR